MDIKYVTEYLLVNLFYIYLLNRFMRIFFNRGEENRWKQVLIYCICYILNSGGNLLFNNPIINMFTSIFSILLISILYKAGISKRIAAILMIYSICITCDIIEATLMGDYIIGKRLSVINIIIVYLLIFSVEIILEKCVQLNDDYNIFKKQMIPSICVPIISIIIICIIVVNKINIHEVVFGASGGLLLINILVFHLYDLLSTAYKEKYKSVLLEMEVQEYSNQIKLINESQQKLKGFQHDFKHHVLALGNLARNNNINEIVKYLENMDKILISENMYVQSGNKDIDSILNYFIQKARDRDIKVMTSIKTGINLAIDFFDINIILGNLIENAIEASVTSKEKIIMLSMELDRNVLYIGVKNSYNNALNISEEKILTNKPDKENHGLGLGNIQKVIEKYNGQLDITYNEKYFIIDAVLYLSE